MTERLRENPNDLDALVGITAEALGMPAVYVEKDFWVTEVLRAASVEQGIALPDGSLVPVTLTFKGGTSLSRVFGIVERFSEDVHLLAEFPAGTSLSARHKILKAVDGAVRNHLSFAGHQVTVGSSTTGVKRYTTYAYPTASPDRSLKEGVLLELGSRGGTQPSASHRYRSLVADHAITILGDDESSWEEFESFSVSVLAPERTLFEKLAAVHDAASRNDTAILLKQGRHFYDIHRLVQKGKWHRYSKRWTPRANRSLWTTSTSRASPQVSPRRGGHPMDTPPARPSIPSTRPATPSKLGTTPRSSSFTGSSSRWRRPSRASTVHGSCYERRVPASHLIVNRARLRSPA